MIAIETRHARSLAIVGLSVLMASAPLGAQNAPLEAKAEKARRAKLEAAEAALMLERMAQEQKLLEQLQPAAFESGQPVFASVSVRVDQAMVPVKVKLVPGESQAEQVDDNDEQNPAPPVKFALHHVCIADESFDQLVYSKGSNAGAARVQLLSLLRKKVADVDLTCRLTPAQQKKINLAGRGDMTRLFGRIEDLRAKAQQIGVDDGELDGHWLSLVTAICQEAAPLRAALKTGPYDGDSLFRKVLRRSLTSEQAIKLQRREAALEAKQAEKNRPLPANRGRKRR